MPPPQKPAIGRLYPNAAQSIATANIKNGPGGFTQYYIPDYENALRPIATIQMTNIK
jgi:hypothetical protein